MLNTVSTDPILFEFCYNLARKASARIHAATSPYVFTPGTRYYLNSGHDHGTAGYAISETGELTFVFSTRRGQGDALLALALADGARHLDCFDGYLVEFYGRHGFVETHRESNWTEGEPDVVFMALPAGTEIGQSR